MNIRKLIKEIVSSELDTYDGMKNWQDFHKEKLINSFDSFTEAYVKAALFTSTDDSNESGGEPMDKKYTMEDIHMSTLERMVRDCKDFQSKYSELYESAGWDDEQAGYDFWLTRNGHGSGYWDRDSSDLSNSDLFQQGGDEAIKEVGKKLTQAAKSYGEYNLYMGDSAHDGEIFGG